MHLNARVSVHPNPTCHNTISKFYPKADILEVGVGCVTISHVTGKAMFQLILTQTHCVGEYLKWGGGLGLIHQSFRSCLSFVPVAFRTRKHETNTHDCGRTRQGQGSDAPLKLLDDNLLYIRIRLFIFIKNNEILLNDWFWNSKKSLNFKND